MKTRKFLIVFVMGFGLLAACQPIRAETLAETGGESVQVEENMGSVPEAPKGSRGSILPTVGTMPMTRLPEV